MFALLLDWSSPNVVWTKFVFIIGLIVSSIDLAVFLDVTPGLLEVTLVINDSQTGFLQ